MLYIPKIGDLIILTDEEVNDFVIINFNEHFKSTRKKLYSKLSEENNLRKIVELLHIFLMTPNILRSYK